MIYALKRKIPGREEKNVEIEPANDSKTTIAHSGLALLTNREKEVLDLIGCGYSNKDIAKVLIISEHTVNDYTKKIYQKLDVHSRHAAAQIINKQNVLN